MSEQNGPVSRGADASEALSGDRPINSGAEDRLGLAPLAERLASALAHQATTEGFVVGVEGRWGSGKSSLLKLTREALDALPTPVRPITVDFRPWLVGNRDALLGSLFQLLAAEIEGVELEQGSSATQERRKKRELVERLRTYSARAEVFGSALSALPIVGFAGRLMENISKAGKNIDTKIPLERLKCELDDALGKLPRKIVVMIDDVDRLEPSEVVELLRLVRSVADFKNVVYLLCYDSKILARNIQVGLKLDDGAAYLEKIVQAVVTVPAPEAFQLRRWLEEALSPIAAGNTQDVLDRLREVVERAGGQWLSTPRSVVRVLNALRLLTPALSEEVDLPDLVWLQLIRAAQPSLYRWIEAYSVEAAASSYGSVHIGVETKKRFFEDLQLILTSERINFDKYRHELAEHLPGIAPDGAFLTSDEPRLFGQPDKQRVDQAVRGRRLASPDHYRLYFALAHPKLAARATDFEALQEASRESPATVTLLLRAWADEKDPALGSKLELMFDRLQRGSGARLDAGRAKTILLALANDMDALGVECGRDAFGEPAIWSDAGRVLPALRDAIPQEERSAIFGEMFEKGRALGWLTTVFRSEIFGHGRYGRRPVGQDEWLLSEVELDLVVEKMIGRYRKMAFDDFAGLENTLSALFAWSQSGDEEKTKLMISKEISHDEGLVRVLEGITGRVHSSRRGIYITLSRDNVSHFMDYDEAYRRVRDIAETGTSDLKSRAERLVKYFQDARDF